MIVSFIHIIERRMDGREEFVTTLKEINDEIEVDC